MVVTATTEIITTESNLILFIIISLIQIGFQSFVLYYLLKVRHYIGNESFWLMAALSMIGLVYDFIITVALAEGLSIGKPITLLNTFFAFVFPSARSCLLFWLTRIMAKGLAYTGSRDKH